MNQISFIFNNPVLKISEKTACDLELVAFIFVAATVRVLFPSSII